MHTVRVTREAVTFLVCQILIGLLAAWAVLSAGPASAQSCPPFPARGVEVIDALWNPAQAQGSDDDRRALTKSILEQLAFEAPAEGWTWKSADRTRPPSKDSLSRLVGGRLCNWDWQNGSTRRRAVQAGQAGDDITGQYPIAVAAVNHLATGPSSPSPPAVDLAPVLARLEALERIVQALDASVPSIEASVSGYGVEIARIEPLAARVEALASELAATAARMATLEGRPIPVSCSAALNFGAARVPISCRLQ